MGIKQDVLAEIFTICKKNKNFVFDNDLVKQICHKHSFANPFDATKVDNTSKFPDILKEENYFLLHLGNGRHQFIKDISKGYHKFEAIPAQSCFDWKYRKSILNEFDTSESNIISVANNQRIIHDFLYEDIVASPKVYNSRRTKTSFKYCIQNTPIEAVNLQMEIDLTMELGGVITVFEGKNDFPEDFAVYQLYHPFRYYTNLKNEKKLNVKEISCCYILRKKNDGISTLRLYNYTFSKPDDMASIKLLKSCEYTLAKR